LQEFMLYDMKSRPEYEANLFASEILLPDDAIFSYAHEGYDIEQIARILYTDINLIALKMASMNCKRQIGTYLPNPNISKIHHRQYFLPCYTVFELAV
jgi:Zn-dependent peptidase ImmA (M78 family)